MKNGTSIKDFVVKIPEISSGTISIYLNIHDWQITEQNWMKLHGFGDVIPFSFFWSRLNFKDINMGT